VLVSRLGLARCPASDGEHLASAQKVQDPGYRRLRIQQHHASVPVLTFMAAISSVVTEAESA
jgi:hypothetical protein